jgi:hypothetical protein
VFDVDAGLTLNERAFRNLAAAEREVGFLARSRFTCEVYPSHLTDAHLEFLQSVRCTYVGVGLQSGDERVLRSVERRTRTDAFDDVIRRLAGAVGNVGVELILGLPGDSLSSFKRTVEHALELGADAHVHQCLVLPDAFLTKAPPEFALRFDPATMLVESCLGWTPDELEEGREWMVKLCAETGGHAGKTQWLTTKYFSPNGAPRRGHGAPAGAGHGPQNAEPRVALPVVR